MFSGPDPHTVLIVADEHAPPGLRPTFLGQPDIRLLTPHDPERALGLAQVERPSLIIEDVPLLFESGLELCARLKADGATAAIPLILVTSEDVEEAARRAGADALVRKPIVQREYFDAVQRFIPLPQRRVTRHAINLRFIYQTATTHGQAFSRDISVCGAFLKTDRALEPGTRMTVRFRLPGDTVEVSCGAIVRRSLPLDTHSTQLAGFGIEFEGIEERDLERMQMLLQRFAKRSVFSRLC